jgi:hypothetical protein
MRRSTFGPVTRWALGAAGASVELRRGSGRTWRPELRTAPGVEQRLVALTGGFDCAWPYRRRGPFHPAGIQRKSLGAGGPGRTITDGQIQQVGRFRAPGGILEGRSLSALPGRALARRGAPPALRLSLSFVANRELGSHLHVRYLHGRRHLPIVTLKSAAQKPLAFLSAIARAIECRVSPDSRRSFRSPVARAFRAASFQTKF